MSNEWASLATEAPEPEPSDVPRTGLASLPARAGAAVIDVVALWLLVLFGMFAAAMGLAFLHKAGLVAEGWEDRVGEAHDGLLKLLVTAAFVGFRALALGIGGATPGKLLFRQRVLEAWPAPSPERPVSALGARVRPCGMKAAFLREALLLVDGLCLGLVGALTMNSSPWKQRVGDRTASTIVVARDVVPASAARDSLRAWIGIAFGASLVLAGTVGTIVVAAVAR